MEIINTIFLKCRTHTTYDERRVATAFKPGMLLNTDGDGKLIPHATDGDVKPSWFAVEEDFYGTGAGGVTRTIDDEYAIDSLGRYQKALEGDVVYAWLAAGENVDEDDFLTSNGDGTLRLAVVGTDELLGKPTEAVDNTAGGAAVRVKVEITK